MVNFNCTAAQRARLSFERNEKLRGANGAGRKSTLARMILEGFQQLFGSNPARESESRADLLRGLKDLSKGLRTLPIVVTIT